MFILDVYLETLDLSTPNLTKIYLPPLATLISTLFVNFACMLYLVTLQVILGDLAFYTWSPCFSILAIIIIYVLFDTIVRSS